MVPAWSLQQAAPRVTQAPACEQHARSIASQALVASWLRHRTAEVRGRAWQDFGRHQKKGVVAIPKVQESDQPAVAGIRDYGGEIRRPLPREGVCQYGVVWMVQGRAWNEYFFLRKKFWGKNKEKKNQQTKIFSVAVRNSTQKRVQIEEVNR